ncbi:MAG: two-CW domain-containing protein [Candidatus Odinarchaeota archaeon]
MNFYNPMKVNCWEVMNCGWQFENKDKIEMCPVIVNSKYNGINGGKNAGRACWMIAGTLCGGKVQGTYAQKYKNCITCEFYNRVKKEENLDFKMLIKL